MKCMKMVSHVVDSMIIANISTLGHPSIRTQFTYAGNVKEGVTLEFTGRPHISAEFFNAIMARFRGERIPGGFSMSDPTPGGLGVWVRDNSKQMNPVKLSPRHASFIAAILDHEGYLDKVWLEGNAVMLRFKNLSVK